MEDEIFTLIEQKVKEMAMAHAGAIENHCKMLCIRYGCTPHALILEFINNLEIKISINAGHLKIENVFYCKDGDVKETRNESSN